ncbi:acyltransferase [Weissella confusa]|uniref:acyltransferase n=1 Tax=Weissella confusa TaxID=1583 RepID=UPI0021F0A137|nr:DapH/DapD/GlmU-related protein [Weissella confusa]MCT0009547.1 acyltransferase [Weissella confusa]
MNKTYKILVNTLAPSILANGGLRKKILKLSGFKIGSGSRINSGFHFDSNNVWIGNNVVINHFFNFFDAGKGAKLTIEDNVFIGPNCHISAMSHEIGDENQRAGRTYIKDVVIGHGAWIGADVKILPGVTVGKGCIIGAGSVLTKSTEDNSLYVGVPARKVKNI